jgi:hypothetical protein
LATIENSKFFTKVAGMELEKGPNLLSTVYPGFRKLHPGYLLRIHRMAVLRVKVDACEEGMEVVSSVVAIQSNVLC